MPTSSVTRSPSGLYELQLSGQFFHPHWVGFLFTGLSHQQVSVVAGKARQDELMEWDARFDLDFSQSAATPESLDYIAMASQSAVASDENLPRLTRYEIAQRENGLEIFLFGPDQMGFLGRCLRRISLLALFPVEIVAGTSDGMIEDRILLRTIAGGAVSDSARASLEKQLREFVAAGQ